MFRFVVFSVFIAVAASSGIISNDLAPLPALGVARFAAPAPAYAAPAPILPAPALPVARYAAPAPVLPAARVFATPAISTGISHTYRTDFVRPVAPAIPAPVALPTVRYATPAIAPLRLSSAITHQSRVDFGHHAIAAPALRYAAPTLNYAAPALNYAAPAVSYAAPALNYAAPAFNYAAGAPVLRAF